MEPLEHFHWDSKLRIKGVLVFSKWLLTGHLLSQTFSTDRCQSVSLAAVVLEPVRLMRYLVSATETTDVDNSCDMNVCKLLGV